MSKKKLYSQSGMTLIEVMVAIGLTSVVSMAVMRLSKDMFKNQRTMEQKANKIDIQANFNRVLADNSVCFNSLTTDVNSVSNPPGGFTVQALPVALESGAVVPAIFKRSPAPVNSVTKIYEIGQSIGDGQVGRLIIRDIRLGRYVDMGNPFLGDDPTTPLVESPPINLIRGEAKIAMMLSKPEDRGSPTTNTQASYGSNLRIVATVTVIKRVDNNKIVECYADENQHLAAMCANLNGFIDPGDGECKQLHIFRKSAASVDTEADFSFTANYGLKTAFGLYIGAGNYATNSATPAHGLGVNMPIPSDGQITASSDIRTNTGNFIAGATGLPAIVGLGGSGNVAASGSIAAQNNVSARSGSVNAGTPAPGPAGTVNAQSYMRATGSSRLSSAVGAGTLKTNVSAAIQADVGDINVAAGNLIANTAILRNCVGTGGGTVVVNRKGVLECLKGSKLSCKNKIVNNVTEIYAMVGYKDDGTGVEPECRKIMSFDNKVCNKYKGGNSDEDSVMIGYTATLDGTTGEIKNVPNCCKKGTGCPHRSTVCANGFDGEMDDCGFTCPGDRQQKPIGTTQTIVYGCEDSNDSYRTTQEFPNYQCGPPEGGSNPITPPRACRLGGAAKGHTYDECRTAGGKVYFFSKLVGEECVDTYGLISLFPLKFGTVRKCAPTSVLSESGREEDSYCLMPQQNEASTSGRSISKITELCASNPTCGFTPLTISKSQIRAARKCPGGWTQALNEDGKTIYQVRANFNCPHINYGNQTGGVSNCPEVSGVGKSYKFTGGLYLADPSADSSEWPHSYIESPDEQMKNVQDHISGQCPAEMCDTWAQRHNGGSSPSTCDDYTNSRAHWSAFSCYAPISGMSCR